MAVLVAKGVSPGVGMLNTAVAVAVVVDRPMVVQGLSSVVVQCMAQAAVEEGLVLELQGRCL